MPKSYDVEETKKPANGRWKEILSTVGGIDARFLSGRAGPCPKCGGKDRWRFTNRDGDGSAICNQCFKSNNGDGLSVLQWANGIAFPEALELVANHVGVKPRKTTGGKSSKNGSAKNGDSKDPAKNLDFDRYPESVQEMELRKWSLKNPPITVEALQAVGARRVRYRESYPAIAIPIIGRSLVRNRPVGWVLLGKDLPVFGKNPDTDKVEQVDKVKMKVTAGSQAGAIGPSDFETASELWKLEGPKDVLAFLSLERPEGVSAVTNSNGAGQNPASLSWLCKLFTGKTARVGHDADKAGQEGATRVPSDGNNRFGWAPAIAEDAGKCTNVVLPFPIVESGGKDLKDFVSEGGTYADLSELAESGQTFEATGKTLIAPRKAAEDPGRLADVNLAKYEKLTDGGRLLFHNGDFFKWNRYYKRVDEKKELRPKLFAVIEEEFHRLDIEAQEDEKHPDCERKDARKVSSALVSNVVEATKARCYISPRIELNTWLPDRSRRNYLVVENGILDIDKLFNRDPDCFLPHSPDWFSTTYLPYPFDPEAECPKWLEYLDQAMEGDLDRMAILQEWAGYNLLPSTDEHSFLIAFGSGRNGKSVYMAGLQAILGFDNCSFVPPQAFNSEFMLADTIGKLANIAGDSSAHFDKESLGVLKTLTSGDSYQYNRKNRDPINATPTARFTFGCNEKPYFSDRSDGIWRRIRLMPFKYEVPDGKKKKGMDKWRYWADRGERPGMLNWAIVGLNRLRDNNTFTPSIICNEAFDEYRRESNPSEQFLEEFVVDGQEGDYIEVDELYRHYRDWSNNGGFKPLSKMVFGRQLKKKFPESEREQKRCDDDVRRYVYKRVKIRPDSGLFSPL